MVGGAETALAGAGYGVTGCCAGGMHVSSLSSLEGAICREDATLRALHTGRGDKELGATQIFGLAHQASSSWCSFQFLLSSIWFSQLQKLLTSFNVKPK
jgi:hypothetical protein